MNSILRYSAALTLSCLVICTALAQGAAIIPPMGSPERRAIMNDLRDARQTSDQAFVVETLKVSGGWGYAVITPQTKSSKQGFETKSLVLQQRAGRWQIVDAICTAEDEKADGTCDLEKSIARIRKSSPHVPDAIFR